MNERRLTTKESFRRLAIKSAIIGATLSFSSFLSYKIPEFTAASFHHPEQTSTHTVTLHRDKLVSIPPDRAGNKEFDSLMRSSVVGLERLGVEKDHFLQEMFGR